MDFDLEQQKLTPQNNDAFDADSIELDLEVEEREPTVLEYARFHGLCTDHSLAPPCLDAILVPTSDNLETDLQYTTDCSNTNSVSELTKERLTLNKEAAFLLKTVHLMQQQVPKDVELPSDHWRRAARLKQEVPILRSDPELDLMKFGNTDIPSLTNSKIPFEVINVENDEGFEWPVKYYVYPAQTHEQAKSEKLKIPRKHIVFLQEAVKDHHTPEDSERIKEYSLDYTRVCMESTNSAAAEAKALEDSIMEADVLVRPDSVGSDMIVTQDDVASQHFSRHFENSPSPHPKRKIEDLKLEGPLTPPMFSDSPTKKIKSVSFSDILHEYKIKSPSTLESGNDEITSEEGFVDFFREAMQPHAEEAKQRVENEKLSEIDTTMRFDVPNVDFSLPIAPWNEFVHTKTRNQPAAETEFDAQMKFLLRVKRDYLKLASSWHGLTKLERDLPWMPFPTQIGSVAINETLHGEEVLSNMLELTTGDIATSSSEVWKRDGLRILEDDEETEDELEMAEAEEQNDIDLLIRKRKLEMEEEEADVKFRGKEKKVPGPVASVAPNQGGVPREVVRSHHWNAPVSSPRRDSTPSRPPKEPLEQQEHDSSLMFGGMFSASIALRKFMEIQGKSVKKVDAGEGRTSSPTQVLVPPNVSSHIRTAEMSQQLPMDRPSEMPPPPLPKLRSIPRKLPPCSFVIATTLLQQRYLTREIEKLYPKAEFIQRDFTSPHSAAGEADLLLSPSTGLIFTTLQQVKQRALPGQRDQSPQHERIAKLQLRYERLIVLVSEGLGRDIEEQGSSRPVDNRDKEAITALELFTSKMEAEIIVKYVRGGELALARSIVGEMASWGLPHGSKDIGNLKMLQDETYWELFLRRAGFNSFAAQVILASLHTSYPIALSSSSPSSLNTSTSANTIEVYGLPAFILATGEERVQRFQVLLGGSRVLTRVNKVLDQEWPSAVNGFTV
ncbi:hypothetical protein K505DRAFT_391227 [Melanomma pulvis-pyrius CBS 109.77]|uniref:Uncharacterized protein n=1 Tax=Melanomma pulvis-pyrius CBS 109.77 TaxID=1314802 RepID=A0A6A6XR34_9PLEO|nr:hypothetical protein K505DRAFT_391227 [Melanomma pulvis-pyrius CBS 109.77]